MYLTLQTILLDQVLHLTTTAGGTVDFHIPDPDLGLICHASET